METKETVFYNKMKFDKGIFKFYIENGAWCVDYKREPSGGYFTAIPEPVEYNRTFDSIILYTLYRKQHVFKASKVVLDAIEIVASQGLIDRKN